MNRFDGLIVNYYRGDQPEHALYCANQIMDADEARKVAERQMAIYAEWNGKPFRLHSFAIIEDYDRWYYAGGNRRFTKGHVRLNGVDGAVVVS